MRSKSTRLLRLVTFLGLFALEMSLVVGLYILPQFRARNAPIGHWQMETPLPDGIGARMAVIAFLGVLAAGNVGLLTMVWRAFKDFKINE
jgi:hypothetical protein